MKKNIIVLCCLLFTILSSGQLTSKDYHDLLDKGRSLDQAKDYKTAAAIFSSAIRAGGDFVVNNDRWESACYWMRANFPDSAYCQLETLATATNMDFDYVSELVSDNDCFLTLHNDQRWAELKKKLFFSARDNLRTSLKVNDRRTIAVEQYKTGIGFLMIDDLDSAFYYLNRAIDSKQLTFQDARGITADNYFFAELLKDKRWPDLERKLFSTLTKNISPFLPFAIQKKSQKDC